jgi:putative transposase
MKYEFIYKHRSCFCVEKMCRALEIQRSGYYRWEKTGKESKREIENKMYLVLIKQIFDDSRKTYGSPRVHAELKRRGYSIAHNRVARLMRENGIRSKRRKKYKATTNSNHSLNIAPNIVNRNFTSDEPNKVWVSDITYIRTLEGWLYLCTILDLFSARVIGWSFNTRLKAELVVNAFLKACYLRKTPQGVIFHSDRGVQFCGKLLSMFQEKYHVIPSMSRRGNCWDNAPAESFFATLKLEEVKGTIYRTRREAMTCIFEYIEVFYNNLRLHSSLGYKTPIEFEEDFLSKQSVYKIG